ncbi:MAG: GNAT family N-acetyltransferase [Gammaproteobacteria bacterium]|jgi:SAM-dependent methyltransferase|nr:GNAT family N-acetyltransferase [Gammaproteobacteria bacterium]
MLEEKLKNLAFPLNVYALVLLFEEGTVDYLHFGLFEQNVESIFDAQHVSTDMILARLPEPPMRILEVGSGLGTTARLLVEKGYDVTSITPDLGQVQLALSRSETSMPRYVGSTLEDLDVEEGSFDFVLFQESAQYIDPLDLFGRSFQLLREGGMVLVVDEFAFKRESPGFDGLHLFSHFSAQSARFGFEILEEKNLSTAAKPTLDYLLRVIPAYQQRLISIGAVTEKELDYLYSSLQDYQEKYIDGRYGYALLMMEKKKAPRWRVSTLKDDEDVRFVRELFHEIFGEPISEKMWQWKYGNGNGDSILAWRGNELVAHYGGMCRDILFKGNMVQAVQIGDVMVRSSERGILTQQGPFFLTAATYLEKNIGFGRRFLLGFGFPNMRAMRVAKKLGLYDEVGYMVEYHWSVLNFEPSLFGVVEQIGGDIDQQKIESINLLWEQMAVDFEQSVVGIRDWKYLSHRFVFHPHFLYKIFVVNDQITGKAIGLFVVRTEGESLILMDLIGKSSTFQLLVQHARSVARKMKMREVSFWVTDTSIPLPAGEKKQLDIHIPSSIWSAGPSIGSMNQCWWLTSGDVDFR